MYLAIDPETKTRVFSDADPRRDDFDGPVECKVSLYVPEDINEWPDGGREPEKCLGVSREDEKKYRVFRFAKECRQADFRLIGAPWESVESWKEWREMKAGPS